MIPQPVTRLDATPIVTPGEGLTFAGLLRVVEHLRFDMNKADSIDVEAVPVQEQKLLP